jgi:hypothetical protein
MEVFLSSSLNSVEASGYPNWIQCPEDKDQYISEFHKCEGIQLDKVDIGLNPAKCGLAKFCLLHVG